MENQLLGLSLHSLRRLLLANELRPVELVEAYLSRIAEIDQQIGAVLWYDAERAIEQTRRLEAAGSRKNREAQKLWGIPLGVKDNIAEEDAPMTCASKILQGYRSPYEATALRRLREAGAIFIARLNMDEFAMGSSNENSAYKLCRNPWDLERTPGGSSGGCSAAVASGQCPAAIGSDTGGSVRQPAAFCGLVGLKPTYGRISRYGLVAYASSLDQIGPITRTIEDAALLLQIMAGPDHLDATCWNEPIPDYMTGLNERVEPVRIGIPTECWQKGVDEEVQSALETCISRLEKAGHTIKAISLPYLDHALAAYYIIAPAEASANLARYDGVRYGLRIEAEDHNTMYKRTRGRGFGPEVKRRILIGTYVLSRGYYEAYYLQALKVRRLVKEMFDTIFKDVDLILAPTAPTPAFRLGEKADDPIKLYLGDLFTVPVNLAGLCGLNLPVGRTAEGLPLGVQLIGPVLGECLVLKIGRELMELVGWPAEGWWMPEQPPVSVSKENQLA